MVLVERAAGWYSLTAELELHAGAPHRLLAAALPLLRPLQDEYRRSVGGLLVPRGEANPGTLGTAFDVWVRLQSCARPDLLVAEANAMMAGAAAALDQLLAVLGATSTRSQSGPWSGPSTALPARDLLRAAWACALLVEVYRTGIRMPGSPLADAELRGPEDLLALARECDLDELGALTDLAGVQLLPRLQDLAMAGPTTTGPAFAGSELMYADADLVVGHTLVELKTGLGSKSVRAGRHAALLAPVLHQMIGYVLHDHDDRYQLSSVALYQARYGHLTEWPLDNLLHRLADRRIELQALRRQWKQMLEAGPTVLLDDIDRTVSATGTIAFTLDGTSYELDLSLEHSRQLRSVLARYVRAGCRSS